MKNKHITLIISSLFIFSFCTFIIIYHCGTVIGRTGDSPYYNRLFNDPGYLMLIRVHNLCNKINNELQNKHYYNKIITRIEEMVNYNVYIKDPLTQKSDWEVCDRANPNIWYRTAKTPYENNLPLWIPEQHPSGIYNVRPQYTPEGERIEKFMRSFR